MTTKNIIDSNQYSLDKNYNIIDQNNKIYTIDHFNKLRYNSYMSNTFMFLTISLQRFIEFNYDVEKFESFYKLNNKTY